MKNKKKPILRTSQSQNNYKIIERTLQFKATDDLILEGLAIPYNSTGTNKARNSRGKISEISETFRSGALANADIENVVLRYNHKDTIPVLAKVGNGSLSIIENTDGVYFRAQLQEDDRQYYNKVKSGLIDKCSFGYIAAPNGLSIKRSSNGNEHWEVTAIAKLTDISIVDDPFHSSTSVVARNNLKNEGEKKMIKKPPIFANEQLFHDYIVAQNEILRSLEIERKENQLDPEKILEVNTRITEVNDDIRRATLSYDSEERTRTAHEIIENVNAQSEFISNAFTGSAKRVNSNKPIKSTGFSPTGNISRAANTDDDIEYRTAFMNYITKKEPIPAHLRAAENTMSTDVAAAIPTAILGAIKEKAIEIGMILPLVSQSNVQFDLNVAINELSPTAQWVGEGEGVDPQKLQLGKISFTPNKLKVAISRTLEAGVRTISDFERVFVQEASKAMLKSLENSIVNGTGVVQPTGILHSTPIKTVEVTTWDFDTLMKIEKAIPRAYSVGAVYCLANSTFLDIISIKDTVGQPIAGTNMGLDGAITNRIRGRNVVIADEYLKTFEEAAAGEIFGFVFRFADYHVNTNYNMAIEEYKDYQTDNIIKQSVMLVDGKVIDNGSLVLLKKK